MARYRRTHTKLSPQSPSFQMAVAVGAINSDSSFALERDIRLLKPSLLYSDRVTLYSPAATMLSISAQTTALNKRQRIKFLKELLPIFEAERAPSLIWALEEYEQLDGKKRGRTKQELIIFHNASKEIEKIIGDKDSVWTEELIPAIEKLLESSGASQLKDAIAAGLLVIDPISDEMDFLDSNKMIDEFMQKLAEILQESGTYPLFDDLAGDLVRLGIDEGLFQTSWTTREHGKQVGAVSEIMSKLPAFSAATIPEILDIRKELSKPLERFRAAMIKFGKLIEAASYEKNFSEEVEELFLGEIKPVLLEIEEQMGGNVFLRELVGKVIGDSKTIVAGALAFGIAPQVDMPQLLTGGLAAATQALASAAWERQMGRRAVSQHELFFLYRTEKLLVGSLSR